MLALIIGGAVIAGLAICIASDPEYVQCIKEGIDWFIKAGYEKEKILQIMHFYLY
jgi:hypothetical protein